MDKERNSAPSNILIYASLVILLIVLITAVSLGTSSYREDYPSGYLTSLITTLFAIAIGITIILSKKQSPSLKRKIGIISLLVGILGMVMFIIYLYPTYGYFSFSIFDFVLGMPMVYLLFGLSAWIFLGGIAQSKWGYLPLILGLVIVCLGNLSMLWYWVIYDFFSF